MFLVASSGFRSKSLYAFPFAPMHATCPTLLKQNIYLCRHNNNESVQFMTFTVPQNTDSRQICFRMDMLRGRPPLWSIFFKSQFILQSVVIDLTECYGEGVLQCLGERPPVDSTCET
jgi:hypothetical protein